MKRIFALALVLCLALTQMACKAPKVEEFKKEQVELKKVTLILDYVPNTNHTGFYVGKAKGFFEEEGIDLEIVEPVDGITNALVAKGTGDFGISYQEDVTYARVNEQPLPIRAIATIIQHNTSGLVSVKEKGIKTPKDFEGKTYAGWGSPAEEAVLKAIMKKSGATPKKLNIITADSVNYESLKDEIDLMWMFRAWDVIAAENEGMELNYMSISEYDQRLDYYTPVIVTSEEMIKYNPKLIKAFLKASEKGYKYAMENPKESAEILSEHVSNYDKNLLVKSQEYLADKYMEGTENWGEMKADVWKGYMEFMKEYGLINSEVEPEEMFTNEFLPYNE